jgi:hypothetical protein
VPSINDAGPPLPVPAIRFLTRAFPCSTLLLLVGHVRTVPMHMRATTRQTNSPFVRSTSLWMTRMAVSQLRETLASCGDGSANVTVVSTSLAIYQR